MLVLSRKTDEQIVIGDGIRITVLRVKGDRVRLGIQACDDVRIMRGELLDVSLDAEDAQPAERIADPAFESPDEASAEDNQAHPVGACENAADNSWQNPRPAWLTICCCS